MRYLTGSWSSTSCGGRGDLRDQILEAETPESKLLALERFLVGRFRPARVDPLVARALEVLDGAPPGSRVEPLAEALGFSHKHFVARFRRSVGLPPKLYSRLLRFQRALRAVPPEGTVRWSEVAIDCGYYDQAHFNRDFRAFSGITPLEYLSLRGDEARFVPVPE
jgi:methylphosphotriester-DNA--protein-cysteine methyltransferase